MGISVYLYFNLPRKQNINQENFNNGYLPAKFTPEAAKRNYELRGIEKCEILSSSNIQARQMIDTLRLRRWKPADIDPPDKDKYDYCFFYSDQDPNKVILEEDDTGDDVQSGRKLADISDPLASSITSCSKEDPWFKDASFIESAFTDSGSETTLNPNLNYKKCVIKIDKQKATPQNVKSFWDNATLNEMACAGILEKLQKENDMYMDRLNEIIEELRQRKQQRDDTYNAKIAYKQKNAIQPAWTWETIKSKLQTCINNNEALRRQIAQERKAYEDSNAYMLHYIDESVTSRKTIERSTSDIHRDIEMIQGRIQGLEDQRSYYNKEVIKMSNLYNETDRKRQECKRKRDEMDDKVINMTRTLNGLKDEVKTLDDTLTAKRQRITEIQVTNTNIEFRIAEISKELKENQLALNECQNRRTFIDAMAKDWQKRALNSKDAYNQCATQRAPLFADVQMTQKLVDMVIAEIQEIKRHCQKAESDIMIKEVEMAQEMGRREVDIAQGSCGTKKLLEIHSAQMDEDINSLRQELAYIKRAKEEQVPCTTVKRVCCQEKKRDKWNDRDKKGNTHVDTGFEVRTTEGRISRVNDGLSAGGNRIRFGNVETGQYTPFLKVLDTKDTDNSDGANNWVRVDQKVLDLHKQIDGDWNEFIIFRTPL